MKKSFLTFVVTAMLLCAMSICVSAIDLTDAEIAALTEHYPNAQYSYNTTYKVAATDPEGEMYGMVAIIPTVNETDNTKTWVIDQDHIVYIDQATADANGNITFSGFAPMGKAANEEGFTEAIVFIGGEGYPTASAMGVLKAYDEDMISKAKISGTITDTASNKTATVTVYDANNDVLGTTTVVNGAYEIPLTAGEGYKVTFAKPGYLTYIVNGVSVTETSTIDVNLSTIAGDVNNDGGIFIGDVQVLKVDYNKSTAKGDKFSDPDSDVNGDGGVFIGDVQTLKLGYNKTVAKDCTVTYSPAN